MKNYLKIIVIFILITSFTGCYTVVWSPEMDFPTSDNTEYYDSYYANSYYGDYYYFYDYPWWYSFNPPVYTKPNDARDNGSSTVRNNGGGRGTNPDRGDIIKTAPPTRSKDTGKESGNTNKSRNDSGSASGNSTDTETNTSPRQNSGGSGDNVRNNDGGRNNGGRR